MVALESSGARRGGKQPNDTNDPRTEDDAAASGMDLTSNTNLKTHSSIAVPYHPNPIHNSST